MIELNNPATWPPLNSVWQHRNGNKYAVVIFTNIETTNQDKYPTTIIYRNVSNLKYYSRKLVDWDRSMTWVGME